MTGKGLFVTATDTGVGKTTVSVGLCVALARAGKRVAVMKPCETGDGNDTEQLIAATRRRLDRGIVNPSRFTLPAAPEVAARRERTRIDLAVLARAYHRLAADADWTIVEGAGGLLVPLAPARTTADLVARLGLPLLLV